MRVFLRDTGKFFIVVALGIVVSGVVALAATPFVLDWAEQGARIVPYEGAVRIFFAIGLLVYLACWGVSLLRRFDARRFGLWAFFAIAVVAILIVFGLDVRNRLQEEYSWIRYTTAAFLVLASMAALLVGRWYQRIVERTRRLRWLWWILALAFFYAAIDEIFQTHEMFGKYIEQTFRIGHEFTDYITVAYAILGIAFFSSFVLSSIREYIPRHAQFVRLFFLACVVYFTSTMLDTFDVWAHARLTAWAAGAQATSPLIFSDFWYPLYAPRQFMNDLEEVFENLAAVLFAGSFLLLWVEKRALFTSPEKRFSRTAMILGLLLVVVGGGALFWSGVHVFSSRETSPAIAVAAQPIVRATDGLFHTDDLSWHDGWGLIIANEGGKNVLRYWPPTAHRAPLADPERLLKDPDSITATDRGIFVSDGTRRSIFRFSEGKGWEKFLTKKDGLDRPEGLAVNGDVMYVVDETARALYFVTLSKREVRKIPITQKKLRTPEGITIHPELGVLITDDTTGYIVRFTLGGEPTVFADPSHGLKNPEGITVDAQGNIWVTDNGRREIIAFSKDGSVIRRMKFRRMYSDLQGIAWGKDARGQDTLYVVTADGYGSSSFIPSTVWEIR